VTQRSLEVIGSTLNGNYATFGGAITSSAALTMTNSTLSGNYATENGGGIATVGTIILNNVTIAGNTADSDNNGVGEGGGIRVINGTVNFKNTLLAGNVDMGGQTPDCTGTLTSQDYNLVQQPAGCTIAGATTHNIVGQDPRLGTLQHNGGPTPTRALLAASPAIDAGGSACAATDQRGIARPQQARCDIGALERVAPPIASLAFKPALIATNGTSLLTITIANASATSPLTGLALSAALPTGLSIAATPPAGNTCGGTLAASPSGSSIVLTGGTLASGASCAISVAVTSATVGAYVLSASAVSATETGAAGKGGLATLTVQTRIPLFLPLSARSA
jgi:predicted outer membrane repeat protein